MCRESCLDSYLHWPWKSNTVPQLFGFDWVRRIQGELDYYERLAAESPGPHFRRQTCFLGKCLLGSSQPQGRPGSVPQGQALDTAGPASSRAPGCVTPESHFHRQQEAELCSLSPQLSVATEIPQGGGMPSPAAASWRGGWWRSWNQGSGSSQTGWHFDGNWVTSIPGISRHRYAYGFWSPVWSLVSPSSGWLENTGYIYTQVTLSWTWSLEGPF